MDFIGNSEQLASGYTRQAAIMNPVTLRARLETRLTHARTQVADLEAALASLNPDIEKALDALSRCGNF